MTPSSYEITQYGAVGDGVAADSDAINRAIEAAAKSGGGTVRVPAGTYRCFSIRLKSKVTLLLEAGSTILAAEPVPGHPSGGYDEAEPNDWGDVHRYQDFGHSHWHNSLIWGEDLEDVSIVGPGRIDGKGLARGLVPRPACGNKAIALKRCRNVLLRDFSVLMGGHFALLATGVDNLTIDHVKVDTNRDGLDIDCCRNVRVSNCSINTPNDDAIVLKTSYALGELRATENVTITNCQVSGYDVGTFLDGTFKRHDWKAPDGDGPTGRIKLGTESNGPFRNIAISNCVFERSRGIAIESVDGAEIEDIAINNIAMRDVTNAPIFLRLGNRARGPEGTRVGWIRRVNISHIVASGVDPRYPILLVGMPEHRIEQVRLSDIAIVSQGGVKMSEVAEQPKTRVNPFFLRGGEPGVTGPREPFAVPERPKAYPEPSMFGLLPSSAMYARHVHDLLVNDLRVDLKEADERPRIVLEHAQGAQFRHVDLRGDGGKDLFVLKQVSDLSVKDCRGIPDTSRSEVKEERLAGER
ncbi:exo-poly-alpha-D-galacturonosidase [Opitutaceae bacterium EW11]|nr:exo-poly-alpha-D-galacturonosidase [Opitutaceae bacterium EW11]